MKIIVNLFAGRLLINGAEYSISNHIRTVKDGTRKTSEVIRSIPDNVPYDPRPFPKGIWEITAIEWQEVDGKKKFDYYTYGPVKIRTNAWGYVNVWELDCDGDYLNETIRQVKDYCYHLHYSESSTTLGCIRFASHEAAEKVARVCERILATGEQIQLEVV